MAERLIADDVRCRPFPPPTITNWVNYRGVSTDRLVEELRYWADAFEALTELEAAAGGGA